MKRKLKRILGLGLALGMVFSVCACGNKEKSTGETPEASASGENGINLAQPGEEDKVYIGVVKYLTGDNQLIGKYAEESCELAVEEINGAGGILGKQLELVYIDEGDGSIDESVNAMSFALEDTRLSAMLFGAHTSNVIPAVARLDASSNPLPVLCGNSGQALSGNGIHDYAYQTRQLDGSGGVERIDVIEGLGDFDNIVIMYPETTSSIEAAASWRSDFETKGYEIPDDNYIGYAESETNFSPYASKVKAIDPDVIVINGSEPDMSRCILALSDAGLKDKIWVGNSTITSTTVTDTAGEASVGIYSFSDWCATVPTDASKAFVNAFNEKYGYLPTNTNAVNYDQIYLLKYAMEQAGSCYDRDAIKKALDEVSGLDLVCGKYNCNTDRNTFLSQLYFVQIDSDYIVQYEDTLTFEDAPAVTGN